MVTVIWFGDRQLRVTSGGKFCLATAFAKLDLRNPGSEVAGSGKPNRSSLQSGTSGITSSMSVSIQRIQSASLLL